MEPFLPVPDPEPNSGWEPLPPRCPECKEIIDARPSSRKDGRREGLCQKHGMVVPTYGEKKDD